MNRFIRPNRPQANAAGPSRIDFGAAKKAILLDPGVYTLRVEHAALIQRNQNTSVALTITDEGSGLTLDTRAIWIAGPNARAGDKAERNMALIADLLKLANQSLSGDPAVLIPSLAGLRFTAELGIEADVNQNPFNSIRAAGPVEGADDE